MRASDILREMVERGENQVMILYRNEQGEMRNIVFQDLVFFEFVGRQEVKTFNKPDELLTIIRNLKNGRYRKVGKGRYSKPVDLNEYIKTVS